MLQKFIALLFLGGLVMVSAVVSTDLSFNANLRSFLLVVGGIFLTSTITYPWSRFKETLRVIQTSFGHKDGRQLETYIDEIVFLTRLNRLDGVRALDQEAQKIANPLLKLGLELVADGRPRQEIRDVLDKEFDLHLSNRDSQISILQTMARLAPAFGLAGTVVGLIKMFTQLNEPSQLGMGMAVALLTTFYGIMVANLILLPLARKIKEYVRFEARLMTLICEGILAVLDQDHPSAVEHRLRSAFLSRAERESSEVVRDRRDRRGLVGPRVEFGNRLAGR